MGLSQASWEIDMAHDWKQAIKQLDHHNRTGDPLFVKPFLDDAWGLLRSDGALPNLPPDFWRSCLHVQLWATVEQADNDDSPFDIVGDIIDAQISTDALIADASRSAKYHLDIDGGDYAYHAAVAADGLLDELANTASPQAIADNLREGIILGVAQFAQSETPSEKLAALAQVLGLGILAMQQ